MFNPAGKAPGVYVEEVTPAGPIAGAGTSVPALIGTVATPPADDMLGKAEAVTSWTEFTTKFGGYKAGLNLPFAVRGFFENGGTFAYVVPVKDTSGLDNVLEELTRFPDVAMVCLPGVIEAASQGKVIGHCETMGDRFAILDGAPDPAPKATDGPLQKQRASLTSDNGFGALYWPWIQIIDPTAAPATPPKLVSVPPSGHVAGVMARCDNTVGVHKAPANEVIRGAVALDYTVNDAEQGVLNNGINCIRSIPGRGLRIWGARTLSANTQWQYVNVRRLVSYLEDSIVQGVSWAVFSPNNTALWKGLERSITEFLTRVWEAGALFGATAKEAFYVQINEELNPAAVRDLGEVFVEIGLAPTRPAEYIVLRIGLWDGGAQVSES